MKSLKITLLFCCCLSFAKAQVVSDSKRAADVYFVNKEYYAAAEYYKRALKISSDSAGFIVPYGFESRMKDESSKKIDYEYLVFQLATSLRLYKNFQDAERWYAIASNFTNPKYALSGYWYGECLRSNLKYEEAITAFNRFINSYKTNDSYVVNAKKAIDACRYALNEIKQPHLVKLKKLAADINQLGSNYAPAVSRQGFYFTSSRPIGNGGKTEVLAGKDKESTKVVKKETPFINTLYTAVDDPNATTVSIKKLPVEVNDMEAAAPTIHPNGNLLFFTAWINKDDKKRSIYFSTKGADQQWSTPQALGSEINMPGFNSMQPSITSDGKYLIFSSDRPGGKGKYDLWYTVLREDGTTGNAVNMGLVNTDGDDEAAYYNPKTHKLLFSSNGRMGLGGLDFYESEGNFATWTTPVNMGYPFNSAKDDIYYSPIDDRDEEGYISSDRESVCCLELFRIKREHLNISGKLIDCATMKPLIGAKVTLTGNDFTEQHVMTDVDGNYAFRISSNRGFKISAVKEDYFAKSLTYSYDQIAKLDTLINPNICLTTFKINKPIVLKNVLYEFDSDQLTEASKAILDNLYDIMRDNMNIEIELSAHTDNIGTAAYNLDLSNRRAKSCVDYLVSKGISASRMTSRGYGFSVPVAPNQFKNGKDNPEGRALNRRTEFKVTKK